MRRGIQQAGFTLLEVMIASSIMIIVITSALSLLIHDLRIQERLQIRSELEANLEKSMEHMRRDLRLSSTGTGMMAFYPSNTNAYEAISLPLGDDLDSDGKLDRNEDGTLQWKHSVLYHVAPGTPDQLRRTVFSPRYTAATAEELYLQLQLVTEGSVDSYPNACLPGESVTSDVVFENLVDLKFRPPKSHFDAYSTTEKGSGTYNFGSLRLEAGDHKLIFTIEGKNASSSGYRLKVDRFAMSGSGSRREGELFTPNNAHPSWPYFSAYHSGGTVSASESSLWSGGALLNYNPDAVPATFTFNVYNDLFCDTSFSSPGAQVSSNCSVKIDSEFTSVAPYISERLVSMDKGYAWTASSAGAAVTNVFSPEVDTVVTVNLSGSDDTNAVAVITRNGRWARFAFERAYDPVTDSYPYPLTISDATISNVVDGTSEKIKFNGQVTTNAVAGDEIVLSDWVEGWLIEREQDYRVSFTVAGGGTNGASQWYAVTNTQALIGGVASPYIPALAYMEVGYPDAAIYRSKPFDTQTIAPQYGYLSWTHQEFYDKGGDVDVRVRSADEISMTGSVWTAARASDDGYFQSNFGNSLSSLPRKRYVQYELLLTCGRWGSRPKAHITTTPLVQDVTIQWSSPSTLVDLLVDFGMGPDCGIVTATVDGQQLVKALQMDIEIYKNSRVGTETAVGTIEIKPMNTGL